MKTPVLNEDRYTFPTYNFLFSELSYPHKEDAIHPEPIVEYDLTRVIEVYEGDELRPYTLPIDVEFRVEIQDGYIIGYVRRGHLYPFVSASADYYAGPGWVKVRINGMVIEPVYPTDSFRHKFFFNFPRRAANIRTAIQYSRRL